MTLNDYKLILKRVAYIFMFICITRIIFFFFNLDYFQDVTAIEVIGTIPYSLRFDISTSLIICLVPILLSIIPYRKIVIKKIIDIVYVFISLISLMLLIFDAKYFGFSGKKATVDMLMIGKDIQNQSWQLFFNFWYVIIIFIVVAYVFIKFRPKEKLVIVRITFLRSISFSILIFIFTGIGIRGGLQMRSLSPKNAFVFDRYELGNLVINSVYTFVRSIGESQLKKVSYFDSITVNQSLKRPKFYNKKNLKRANIVIFLLESFSYEYFEQGYMPFLKKLSRDGVSFTEAYANGRRSIEVLPSIMNSIPSIVGTPISQSQFQTNNFSSLPFALKSNGYKNLFFHGGKPGTMDFDSYSKSIGFDQYLDSSDYPDKNHYDGTWGIFDHRFMDFMLERINQIRGPFFSTFFSLSSHQPYTIPSKYKGKFSKGELDIHESIGYVDYSLERFFAKARKKKWFKNTVFIFTADHTQKLMTKKFNNVLGRYRVPLIIYNPRRKFKMDEDSIAQHVDIFPTVLDILGIQRKLPKFGRSLFDNSGGRMLNYYSSNFIYKKGKDVLIYNDEIEKQFIFTGEKLDSVEEVAKELRKELKLYIQYGVNGLIDDDL